MSDNKGILRGSLFGIFSAVVTFVLIGMLITSLILNIILAIASTSNLSAAQSSGQADQLDVKVLSGTGNNKVLVIPVNGIIIGSAPTGWGDEESATTPERIQKQLKQAEKDKDIKAIILKINSPGGTITATDTIYEALRKYNEESKVPIVAYMDEVAASGGYYLAVTADKIIAQPTTITGSIGVIMSFYQIQDLLENKLGIHPVVIKSGKHKDIGSSSRPMSDSDREILHSLLDEMYQRFVDKVKKGRPQLAKLESEKFAPLVDGRIFTGVQAKEHGLIDSCGRFQDAVAEAATLAGFTVDQVKVIYYQKKRTVLEEILHSPAVNTPERKAMGKFLQMASPRFYYMWRP